MDHFAKIAAALTERELDAVLLTSHPNRLYAAGFSSSAGAAVVTRAGAWFFTDSRYIEAAQRAVPGAVVRQADAAHSYASLINEVLAAQGVSRMGFEDGRMSVAEHAAFSKKLNCELVPVGGLMEALRAVKDEEETGIMIAAQNIASRAFTELLNEIRVGVTERELAARLQYLMVHYGGEKASFDTIVVSGANSSMPHGVPTDKPLAAGDFVTFDFGCKYRGYCSDTTRTVAVGHATDDMREIYETVLAAQKAGIAAARPGVTGKEVDAAARDVIAAAGYGEYFGHGFGHGLGIEVHELPNAAPSYDQPLPAGAVISAEPGIYLPGKMGVRIEDILILTPDGSRNITDLPKDLLIL